MKNHINRRDFVAKSLLGATASLSLPAFLQQSLFSLNAQAQSQPDPNRPILVLMELAGGNDTLNTVIPYANSSYLGARSTIRLNVGDHQALALGKAAPNVNGGTDTLALHPNLTAFHQLWGEGDLAIINGVGYPNANLSHFTSFDYWHSAEPNTIVKDGWIGRYLDTQCDGCPATTGVFINRRPTLAFKSSQGVSPTVTFNSSLSFDWGDASSLGRETSSRELYRKLIGLDHQVDDGLSQTNPTLAYAQKAAHNSMESTASVQASIGQAGALLNPNWPSNGLANSLRTIAQLIKGDSDTSIYYARQGGYDTHNNQVVNNDPLQGRHFDLLNTLNGALGAFVDEMKRQGKWDRVVILAFSEFGRKVIQNGSSGTDHGAAQSLFVMGGQVVGNQYYGKFPDLAAQARIKRNSLDYNTDFRTVYRTLLQNWLGIANLDFDLPQIFPSYPTNFAPLAFLPEL